MRDVCRKMFLRFYSGALGIDAEIESQRDYAANIVECIKTLIGKASQFHYGPVDSFVSFSFDLNPISESLEFRGRSLI